MTRLGRDETMLLSRCPICGDMIDAGTDFKDQLSREEFMISGLCQHCQDLVFYEDEPE